MTPAVPSIASRPFYLITQKKHRNKPNNNRDKSTSQGTLAKIHRSKLYLIASRDDKIIKHLQCSQKKNANFNHETRTLISFSLVLSSNFTLKGLNPNSPGIRFLLSPENMSLYVIFPRCPMSSIRPQNKNIWYRPPVGTWRYAWVATGLENAVSGRWKNSCTIIPTNL